MSCLRFLPLAAIAGLMSCNTSAADAADAGEPAATVIAGADTEVAAAEHSATSATQPKPPLGNYRLLGVKDPDLDNLVAFALKVPREWVVKQRFWREWDGAAPVNKVYIVFCSPDARQQVEFLPATTYFYIDGPQARSLRQHKEQMGMGTAGTAPNELAPMAAAAYLQEYLLPQLAQHPASQCGEPAPDRAAGEAYARRWPALHRNQRLGGWYAAQRQPRPRGSAAGPLPDATRRRNYL